MNSNLYTVFNVEANNFDDSIKAIPKNTHSTDTEPEVEAENENPICHKVIISANNTKKGKFMLNNDITSKKVVKNAFKEFAEAIPDFEYDQRKIRRNQMMKKNKTNKSFYKIEMNNYRFLNYFDAFLNIAEHCQKNNQKFSRDNCKEYLKDCYIIDFSHDSFIPLTSNLSPKLFNKYYRLAQREQKYF